MSSDQRGLTQALWPQEPCAAADSPRAKPGSGIFVLRRGFGSACTFLLPLLTSVNPVTELGNDLSQAKDQQHSGEKGIGTAAPREIKHRTKKPATVVVHMPSCYRFQSMSNSKGQRTISAWFEFFFFFSSCCFYSNSLQHVLWTQPLMQRCTDGELFCMVKNLFRG